MSHPIVMQLRFTRSEFARALEGLTDAEARRRLMPMNCISWNVGHLAWQEQRYFLLYGQGQLPWPWIDEQFAYGASASTPELEEVLTVWRGIAEKADLWLDSLTTDKLQDHVALEGKRSPYVFGSLLQRVIYHYWYHTGEILAIRQLLGHRNLAEFVGDLDSEAPYRPE